MCVYTSESLHGPRVRANDRVLFVGCWWARRLSTGDGASSHCTIRVCVVSVCCAVIGELKGRVCFNTQGRIKNDGAHHTRNRFVPNKKACLLSFSIHARLVVRIFPTRYTQLRSHTPRHSLAPPQSLGPVPTSAALPPPQNKNKIPLYARRESISTPPFIAARPPRAAPRAAPCTWPCTF